MLGLQARRRLDVLGGEVQRRVRALRAGDVVKPEDVAVLRPAAALAPSDRGLLVGMTLTRDVPAGAPFLAADLAVVERA